MADKKFSDVFRDALDKIETDARKVDLNLTQLCKMTGISRATPDRWRKKMPKTIELIDEMQDIIVAERDRTVHEPK